MSFSILQVVFILFISLSFSKPNVVIAHITHSFLNEICHSDGPNLYVKPDLCLKILESDKKIASSKNKTDFSIAVIEAGISNGTNTRTYVENKLKEKNLNPNLKGVLQKCKLSYDAAVASLHSALGEVKIGEYLTSTYDLMIASSDNIDICRNEVARKRINDATILTGNKVVSMFGMIANNVVSDLRRQQPLPPLPAMNSRRQLRA